MSPTHNLGLSESNQRIIEDLLKFDLSIPEFSSHKITFIHILIIVKNVSQQHHVITYGDASVRMKSCDIEKEISNLFDFPLFACYRFTFEFAHDGMIEYNQYPKSRKDLSNLNSITATGFLIRANDVKEKLVEPWLDCALHMRNV